MSHAEVPEELKPDFQELQEALKSIDDCEAEQKEQDIKMVRAFAQQIKDENLYPEIPTEHVERVLEEIIEKDGLISEEDATAFF